MCSTLHISQLFPGMVQVTLAPFWGNWEKGTQQVSIFFNLCPNHLSSFASLILSFGFKMYFRFIRTVKIIIHCFGCKIFWEILIIKYWSGREICKIGRKLIKKIRLLNWGETVQVKKTAGMTWVTQVRFYGEKDSFKKERVREKLEE